MAEIISMLSQLDISQSADWSEPMHKVRPDLRLRRHLQSYCRVAVMATTAYAAIIITAVFYTFSTRSNGEITYIEVRRPLPGQRAPPGSPWPMPKSWKATDQLVTLDPEMYDVSSNAADCDVIDHALQRYRQLIFIDELGSKAPNLTVLEGLQINVDEDFDCEYPKHGDDESYELDVPPSGKVTLKSMTIWGALRGLETFSQLVYLDSERHYLLNVSQIKDSPRYKYRGMLLDTARHFLPFKVLKQNLDAMAFNKFNAFHWHIIDDQSFPFESKVFPNLTTLGAYTPKHVYTQEQIGEIIQYARDRGIRVIPEFDTPGHTQAFGKAFPWLLTPCYGEGPDKPYTPNYTEHASAEILNPMLNDTYRIFKELVKEVKGVFVDEYVHLGMDEVYYACWKSNPEIAEFMKKQNFTEYNQVEQYYVKRTLQNVKDLGYKYMLWQDPIDNDVQVEQDSIVGVWKDNYLDKRLDKWQNYIAPIAKKGYQIVLSACWYLNYISYGMDWKRYYECDPRNFNGTDSEKDLVVGGEVCMWGEHVDGTNLIARLWPRASAVAERLWSPASVNDTDSAAFRLDQQRCRMLRRGIAAQPILNGFCGEYEWDMD